MNESLDNTPSHVAIIMDGNGRWAKLKGKSRLFGHKNGIKSVQKIVEYATKIEIKNLTLYAFSTENWNRPKKEIETLMSILIDQARKLLPEFMPTEALHKVQKDMCKAGSWLDKVPLGVIIETVPQDSIVKLQQEALPEYRKLAANLIDQFISEFELQGGNRREITEKYESMYQWIR